MSLQTFEDLDVWKRGCRLTVDLHVATHKSKDYALKDQMERSSLSVPSNIAEGAERDSEGDFVRFLRIAKGSCGELRTQLFISQRIRECLQLEPLKKSPEMIQETREISAMLQGLIKSVQSRKKNKSQPPKKAAPPKKPKT